MLAYYASKPAEYDKLEFYKAIRKEFREYDIESLKGSVEYLKQVVALRKAKAMSNITFVQTFDRASRELIAKGELDEVQQCKEFMQGLPEEAKSRIFKDAEFGTEGILT